MSKFIRKEVITTETSKTTTTCKFPNVFDWFKHVIANLKLFESTQSKLDLPLTGDQLVIIVRIIDFSKVIHMMLSMLPNIPTVLSCTLPTQPKITDFELSRDAVIQLLLGFPELHDSMTDSDNIRSAADAWFSFNVKLDQALSQFRDANACCKDSFARMRTSYVVPMCDLIRCAQKRFDLAIASVLIYLLKVHEAYSDDHKKGSLADLILPQLHRIRYNQEIALLAVINWTKETSPANVAVDDIVHGSLAFATALCAQKIMRTFIDLVRVNAVTPASMMFANFEHYANAEVKKLEDVDGWCMQHIKIWLDVAATAVCELYATETKSDTQAELIRLLSVRFIGGWRDCSNPKPKVDLLRRAFWSQVRNEPAPATSDKYVMLMENLLISREDCGNPSKIAKFKRAAEAYIAHDAGPLYPSPLDW